LFHQEGVKIIDILAASDLKRIVVIANIAVVIFILLTSRIGAGYLVAGFAIGPADSVVNVIKNIKTQKGKQVAVKCLRFVDIGDMDRKIVNADNALHMALPVIEIKS
jgi:hypothetical protein